MTEIPLTRINMPEFSPEDRAYFEIERLRSVPELQTNQMIGGPTPPAMQEENKRRRAEHKRHRLEIIAKHGIANTYLEPLFTKEKQLAQELAEVRQEIAELQAIQKS